MKAGIGRTNSGDNPFEFPVDVLRLQKVEMFYGEQFESVEDFIHALDEYIYYYNNQ